MDITGGSIGKYLGYWLSGKWRCWSMAVKWIDSLSMYDRRERMEAFPINMETRTSFESESARKALEVRLLLVDRVYAY